MSVRYRLIRQIVTPRRAPAKDHVLESGTTLLLEFDAANERAPWVVRVETTRAVVRVFMTEAGRDSWLRQYAAAEET